MTSQHNVVFLGYQTMNKDKHTNIWYSSMLETSLVNCDTNLEILKCELCRIYIKIKLLLWPVDQFNRAYFSRISPRPLSPRGGNHPALQYTHREQHIERDSTVFLRYHHSTTWLPYIYHLQKGLIRQWITWIY